GAPPRAPPQARCGRAVGAVAREGEYPRGGEDSPKTRGHDPPIRLLHEGKNLALAARRSGRNDPTAPPEAPVEPAVGAVAHESLGEGRVTFARPRRHELPVRLLHEAVGAGNALDPCARDPGASEAPIEVARPCAGTRRCGQRA